MKRIIMSSRSLKVLALTIGVLFLLTGGALASEFVISLASNNSTVQQQPGPNRCHMLGTFPFNMSDLSCTPGALNAAVTQATIGKTICRVGYTSTVRPSTSVTGVEKLASMRAYGLHKSASRYEYDHLISLELGGATNDARNLWPEPGGSPNLKDRVENYLHSKVCNRSMSLARAQHIIAKNWVNYYLTVVKTTPPAPVQPQPPKPTPPTPPTPPSPSHPAGATGQCVDGTYTYAIHHQGACSHHGGVETWF